MRPLRMGSSSPAPGSKYRVASIESSETGKGTTSSRGGWPILVLLAKGGCLGASGQVVLLERIHNPNPVDLPRLLHVLRVKHTASGLFCGA